MADQWEENGKFHRQEQEEQEHEEQDEQGARKGVSREGADPVADHAQWEIKLGEDAIMSNVRASFTGQELKITGENHREPLRIPKVPPLSL